MPITALIFVANGTHSRVRGEAQDRRQASRI
jgi:hypothetical protein